MFAHKQRNMPNSRLAKISNSIHDKKKKKKKKKKYKQRKKSM
jgi:hypothetical protein